MNRPFTLVSDSISRDAIEALKVLKVLLQDAKIATP